MKDYEKMVNCNDTYCEYFDERMELNCAYSEDNSECIKTADAYSLLGDVRADIQELLKSIDEYHETFSTAELESFSRQKLDAGIKMMRLKNKISEHFS